VDVKTQIQKYRDLLAEGTRRMREQRIGPSSTERLLALAQALGSPTRTGKFGERMGLIAGTLGGQQRAQLEAEIARADTLEKLGLKSAEFDVEAAQTRANRLATLMARQMAANKPVAGIEVDGVLRNPYTGARIVESLPVYTPEQALAAKAAAGGGTLRFRTTDGRELEI
jgi:hypothetical protein